MRVVLRLFDAHVFAHRKTILMPTPLRHSMARAFLRQVFGSSKRLPGGGRRQIEYRKGEAVKRWHSASKGQYRQRTGT